MIDAINDMCITYGRQLRRVYLGGYRTNEGGFHFDGAAVRSVMDAIRWEREGAGQGPVERHYHEVLTGDALDIRRASEGLPEHRLYLLRLHYVVPKFEFPTKRKIHCMCEMYPEKYIGKRHYYENLDKIHVWLAARVNLTQESPDLVRTANL